jgi:N-acetylglucosamine malate deacetylase 1
MTVQLFSRVLVIGAHADDSVIGAGASIHRFAQMGCEIYEHTFSNHSRTSNWTKNIPEEHRIALSSLGVPSKNVFLGWWSACTGQMQEAAAAAAIRKELEELRDTVQPDLVISHIMGDTNQDHAFIAEEVYRTFKHTCSVWGFDFPSNYRPDVPAPGVHVLISLENLEAKITALSQYTSQIGRNHAYMSDDYTRSLASIRAAQSRRDKPYAESFHSLVTML